MLKFREEGVKIDNIFKHIITVKCALWAFSVEIFGFAKLQEGRWNVYAEV